MTDVLTMNEKMYIASNLKELLSQSYKEFQRWKSSRNEVFLQQACEKVFSALEHFVELRRNINIHSHADFSREFRLLSKTDADRLIPLANYLHRFFYEGQGLDADFGVIEKDYLVVYKFLKVKS
jgi:hypothetical protein